MNSNQYVRVPEPVEWRQGMLISPQHFQQQDIYLDRLTTHKMFVSQPHYWGLTDISLSEMGLRSNKIVIDSLHGVLRNGQIIEIGDGARLEADLPEPTSMDAGVVQSESGEPDLEDSILVSLGVFRDGATSDEGVQQRPQKRYMSFNCPDIADENNANLTVDMRKKRVLVQIFLGEDIPGIYETIPLFRVKAGHDGYRVLNIHPPMIDAKVSKTLFGDDSLWVKAEKLVSSIRRRAADMAGSSSRDSRESAEARAMSAMLAKVPTLEVLLNMNMVHPFQLYIAVVDLAAAVSSLSLSNKPLVPPGYDHNRPDAGFQIILTKLLAYVDKIKPDFTTYVFDSEEPGKYELDLPAGVNLQEMVIRLLPEEGQHSEGVVNWIKSAKISSDRQMARLRKGRLRGLTREEMDVDRRKQLRLPEVGVVVSVSNKDKEDLISAKGKLQIQGSRDLSPERIYLCVPRPAVK